MAADSDSPLRRWLSACRCCSSTSVASRCCHWSCRAPPTCKAPGPFHRWRLRRRLPARALKQHAGSGRRGVRSRARRCGCISCSWARSACSKWGRDMREGRAEHSRCGACRATSWRLLQVECMYDDIVACVVRAQHHMCYASACLHLARLEGILGTRAVHQNVCTCLRAGGNACACQLCSYRLLRCCRGDGH
jgi:hypothetical protein